jgi:hypothetical protein
MCDLSRAGARDLGGRAARFNCMVPAVHPGPSLPLGITNEGAA